MPPNYKTRRRSTGLPRPPRRLQFGILFTVILIIIVWTTASTKGAVPSPPTVAGLSEKAKHAANIISKPKLPKLYNVFGDAAHEPPEQEDSSHGRTKWHSDWKWLHPFSSDTTLDEQRAVLPPLVNRAPIYTFYDTKVSKDPKVQEAERKLLMTWRRAWWAQGFMPVVLGRNDAAKHPQYQTLQKLKPSGGLEVDMLRWLAWAHMGGGILTNWLCLPMAPYDDRMLTSLRHANFTTISRYPDLSNGLFTGSAEYVNAAVKLALSSKSVGEANYLSDLLSSKSITISDVSGGIAYYDMTTISSKYNKVGAVLRESQPDGLSQLQQLINAHLHITWQNTFTEGIAVLQPYPMHTTTLVEPAVHLARSLLQCPESLAPESCPPNRPGCNPCSSTSAFNLDFYTPGSFRNWTTQFTIGTVPHPYTLHSLNSMKETLDVAFVRRETERDAWLRGTTFDLLGPELGGPSRITRIKEAVASPFATSHSLWMTPELEEPIKADWIFGFALPVTNTKVVSGVAPRKGALVPTSSELARENMLLALAKETVQQKSDSPTMKMVEAWNLADVEAWRFVKAYTVRRRMERERWQAKESQFAGAEDSVSTDSAL